MKHLTITVPCFNSEQYLKRCLDSLVAGGNEVEIIVVNDGSTDHTGEIAEQYCRQFPDIVTVVHKENGGHGSGVNTGLALATGKYFKVVDSDDWLEEKAYKELLGKIRRWLKKDVSGRENCPDMLICDYTYNHLNDGIRKTINYRNIFPIDKVCSWDKIGIFRPHQYLVMHALIYLDEVKENYPKLANYMCRNISIMLAISSIHLLLRGDEQAKVWYGQLWSDIKRKNPKLYYRLRYTTLSGFTNLPGRLGKKVTITGYRIAKRIYKFQ